MPPINIICKYASLSIFIVNKKYFSWHQDLTYWGLDGEELVTAWVALSPSTLESGCMKILPGSHLDGENPHHDTYGKNNILHRGQELEMEVDEDKTVSIELHSQEQFLFTMAGFLMPHIPTNPMTDG